MPTYQTTPYISWTFPDQAIAMNRKGVRPLESTRVPKQDMVIGSASPWQKKTHEMVLAGLQTNRSKEAGMLYKKNTTDRTQAFDRPAHLSQTRINGKFEDPSYQFTQTAGGLRGGTGLITPEGRAWGKQQLLNRIDQLNAIDTGDYSRGKPERTNLDPKLDNLDVAFMRLMDDFGAGYYTSHTVELSDRLILELANVGAVISANKLASYAESLSNLQVQVQGLLGTRNTVGGLDVATRKKILGILKSLQRNFNRFQQLAEEIARVVYEPENVRKQVMTEILARLPKAIAVRGTYTPTITPGGTPQRPFISESPYEKFFTESG